MNYHDEIDRTPKTMTRAMIHVPETRVKMSLNLQAIA
jgi:hypothetical protein